ncbi:MAG: hypothetical protein OEV81_01715 [Betaproteobacteria bacterium]|nr:hypothetical protein [Betaproteobacteria bacterium]MDH5222699.1 hypothetical protein [Betaproteobacteria bacterium]MDH5352230.1 hypothetical protein [Betaproteobacteria bacterium]
MKAALAAACLALAGCGSTQIYPTVQVQLISLAPGELDKGGVAFITPSTVTGQEQETQAVALTFADVLKRERPALRVVTLAETLGAINRAGLADAYKRMYNDYRDTGLFSGDVLRKVSGATGARYAVQLKLQRFEQGSRERFGLFGIRIVETKYAHVRLFLQVWDCRDSTIVWEGMQEMRHAHDTMTEEPVMQRTVLERTARDLIARLP